MKPSNFDSPQSRRASQLISALFDGRISAAEQEELETQLLSDPRICELYVCLAHLHAGLYKYASALGSIDGTDVSIKQDLSNPASNPMNETMVLPALSNTVSEADFASSEEEKFAPTPYAPPQNAERRYNWYLPAGIAAMLMIGAGILIFLSILSRRPAPSGIAAIPPQPPAVPLAVEPPPPVATVELVSKPVWQTGYTAPAEGKFGPDQSLLLVSGVVQMQLHGGGRLVVEGPASLHFLSYSKLELNKGKIVALVPGGGLIVQCPSGSVTDLGTEFGLEVHPSGATDVAVFQGSVSASLASTATTQPAGATMLTAGQAAVITEKTIARSAEGAIPQRFISSLKNEAVTSLDVTDLVSGGDGTTERRGIAIDSTNGHIGNLPTRGNRKSDGQFHRIDGYPVLDGAFIPNGAAGEMIVDSAGDRFRFSTATDITHNLIETGGPIRWDDPIGISTKLSGVDYSKPGHGVICTHCNNGLTLNLNTVRRLYPDRRVTGFRCRMGNSYVNGWGGAAKRNPVAGAFVLMDGKVRYEKPKFSNQDGSFLVNIPILPNDRFLTLAVTDAETDIDEQWILWADARLDIIAAR